MNRFNLTEWALDHRQLTGFMIVLLVLGGAFAYFRLGQREDPAFTFRVMVVKTLYPGATATEVELEVTDRLEKKVQELPALNVVRSYSKPGESVIFVELRQDTTPREVAALWYQTRKKVGDIRHTLPAGVVGPFFNDEFGDTYSSIYAFSSEGFSYAELKDVVESARQRLLRLKDVEKVDLIGAQDERIYVEFSDKRLAELGVDARQVAQALQAQNAVTPSGAIVTPLRNIPLRMTGKLDTVESVAALPLRLNGHAFRVSDIANVTRGYADPPEFKMRFNGKEVIGIGITMNDRGDVLDVGRALEATMAGIRQELPIGIEVAQVADQPRVVKAAVGEFMRTFLEAVAIVMIVSFASLGLRTGTVVALTVPLVLAGTFLAMLSLGIGLHRISLGALILALGLLVDDAMIAVEMMARKMEEGWERYRAAAYAYSTTAFPMLTGTLVTVAGFLPVGLARSNAGEYTVAIFQVTAIALLLSWVGAVIFTPFIGSFLLKTRPRGDAARHEMFDTPFYNGLRRWLNWCVEHRFKVIAATGALFAAGLFAFVNLPQQFFPLSNRPEVIVDVWLPEGASFAETEAAARHVESLLAKDEDVLHYATYVGGGTPRFFLLISQQLGNTNLAQVVVMTRDNAARERVMGRMRRSFASDLPDVRGRVSRLDVGPPIEYPVIFRVSGEDARVVRRIADEVKGIVRANSGTVDVNDDWHERITAMRMVLDQDKARALGVSTEGLGQALQAHYTGISIGQYRDGDKQVDIVWRAQEQERRSASDLSGVAVASIGGRPVPLSQLVKFEPDFEPGVVWRRNRYPTISIRADVVDGAQGPDVSREIARRLEAVEARLPPGYAIEAGAALEESSTAQRSIFVWLPLVGVVTLVLLMIQLQSIQRTLLVCVTAPLGVIGAGLALHLFRMPFGFVALLGLIALAGMIMRNAVILVDQIEQDERNGRDTWEAIVESTVRRFRPIVLTAAAAILAMIPLSRSDFFGPQAVAIMGGLTVATGLTIVFLPALYAAWFRVRRAPGETERARGDTLAYAGTRGDAALDGRGGDA